MPAQPRRFERFMFHCIKKQKKQKKGLWSAAPPRSGPQTSPSYHLKNITLILWHQEYYSSFWGLAP
jgi:hypothetical protein